MSLLDFLAGLLTPFLVNGILLLGLRQFGRRESVAQGSLVVVQVAVFVVSVVVAIIFWGSRRSLSWGLIASIALGAAVSLFWWASHSGNVTAPR